MTMKKVYEKPAIVYTELNGARAVVCAPIPPAKTSAIDCPGGPISS